MANNESIPPLKSGNEHGKLKIFLGYAAGVGKTYAMVEAAQQRHTEKVDVIVGSIEAHEKTELAALLQPLEIIPSRFRNEPDIDAILIRHPQLVLMDDLAHLNHRGARHPQRYHDVEELLNAGINVYATLNIQDLESLNDIVRQITSAPVSATVPDRIFDEADEIELVDLPPDELLNRLNRYAPSLENVSWPPAVAPENFSKEKLTALRELALRRMSQRIDKQIREYIQTESVPRSWRAGEHLLVCLNSEPPDEHLVREAHRLSLALDAEWTVLYVQTSRRDQRSRYAQEQRLKNLKLAEELGGKTAVVSETALVEAITEYTRTHNITKILLSRDPLSRIQQFIWGSLAAQLEEHNPGIDIFIVGNQNKPTGLSRALRAVQPRQPWQRYVQSLALIILGSLLGAWVHLVISPVNLVMIYLLIVVIAAIYLGRGPAIVASFFGMLALDFFFIPPYFSLTVSDTEYLLTFLGLFVVGVVISGLTAQVKEQAEAARIRENATTSLYALSRDLAVAGELDDAVRVIQQHIKQTFNRDTQLFLLNMDNQLYPYGLQSPTDLEPQALEIAEWTFNHQQPAGADSHTHPEATISYLPLRTAHARVGVLGIRTAQPEVHLNAERRQLLDTFASLVALALERVKLAEAAQQAQLIQDSEKLQTALLNSISHDLRTPLVSITGALSSLDEDGSLLDDSTRANLIETAREEAERLNRLVGNLLDMTRLEAGILKVRRELYDAQDIIGTTLEPFNDRLQSRSLKINVPSDLPLVPVDIVLIAHALGNVIDNALKYSLPDAQIDIVVTHQKNWLKIQISNQGPSIPEEDLTRIFEKFYRIQRPNNVSGTGLGLSISKGIVEAHGGQITAENRSTDGVTITISLPLLVDNRQ